MSFASFVLGKVSDIVYLLCEITKLNGFIILYCVFSASKNVFIYCFTDMLQY